MGKKSADQSFLLNQINIVRCFPRIACEVRDLLVDHVKDASQKYMMLECTAITAFLVRSGIVEFAECEESRDSERVWAFMMCYIAIRPKSQRFQIDAPNIEQAFERVATITYKMYVRATAHERTSPPSG